MLITASSRTNFRKWLGANFGADCLPDDDQLWSGMAALARAFHFSPSEIDGLDLGDFLEWIRRC